MTFFNKFFGLPLEKEATTNSVPQPDYASDPAYVFTKDTKAWTLKSGTFHDELADKYYASDAEFVKFNVDASHSLRVHKYTARHTGFYCEFSHEWWHWDWFSDVVVDNNTVCLEACGEQLHYWRRDYSYHWTPEPALTDIPDYHHIERPSTWNRDKGYGVELEINSEKRFELAKKLPEGIFGERDGSLNAQEGIELVGPPMAFQAYQEPDNIWNNALALTAQPEFGCSVPTFDHKLKRICWCGDCDWCDDHDDEYDEPEPPMYGMHISVSRSMFNNFSASKFIVFLNMQDRLCKLVAERPMIYDGSYKIRKKIKDCFEKDHWAKKPNAKILVTDKYEAVSVRDARLEVRIFASTLTPVNFYKNIEFVHAVREWTKTVKSSVLSRVNRSRKSDTGSQAFCKWLKDQNDYLNLKEYLKSKVSSNHQVLGLENII